MGRLLHNPFVRKLRETLLTAPGPGSTGVHCVSTPPASCCERRAGTPTPRMSGREEALAASQILDAGDPTLLTSKEIKDSWGSCLSFFQAYGLKPWSVSDCAEARTLSKSLKEAK